MFWFASHHFGVKSRQSVLGIFDIADYIYSKIIVVRYVNHTATLKLLAITTISVYTNSLLEEGFAFTANQAFSTLQYFGLAAICYFGQYCFSAEPSMRCCFVFLLFAIGLKSQVGVTQSSESIIKQVGRGKNSTKKNLQSLIAYCVEY